MEAKKRINGYTRDVLFWAWVKGYEDITRVILESAAEWEPGNGYSIALNLVVTGDK